MNLPRSLVFVPGARPDMVAKVPRWSPDAVARGVGVVDGEMVDDVHLRTAAAVLARAGSGRDDELGPRDGLEA